MNHKKPATRQRFHDIRVVKKAHSKKKKTSIMQTLVLVGKFTAVFWIAGGIFWLGDTLATQFNTIESLRAQIEEREKSTFVVVPEGKAELVVAPKAHKVIHYKGYWVNSEILEKIDKTFGQDAEIFKAILIVESSGGQYHENHNCRYDKAGNLKTDGTGRSDFCKSKYHAEIGTDSVDCGYLQINFPKRTSCPKDVFSPQKQVELAYNIYKNGGCGGLECWSSYKYDRSKITNVLEK